MAKKYAPEVAFLIAHGKVLPDNREDDYYFGVEHAKDLLARLGVEAEVIGTDDAFSIKLSDENTAGYTLLNAQTTGKNKDGGLLYASDFRLLGQITGFTL